MAETQRCGYGYPVNRCKRRPVEGVRYRSHYSVIGICRRHLALLRLQGRERRLVVYERAQAGVRGLSL